MFSTRPTSSHPISCINQAYALCVIKRIKRHGPHQLACQALGDLEREASRRAQAVPANYMQSFIRP